MKIGLIIVKLKICKFFRTIFKNDMNNFLKTDEYNEISKLIELLLSQSKKLDDIYNWKWVILTLHSALQGFMIIALRDSAGLNILRDKIANKWLEAYRNDEPYPVEILDSFLNLYDKIKSDIMLRFVHSKKFESSNDHDRSVKKLNSLRNDFIHFIPRGWLIEVSGLPKICIDCLEIIEFLGWSSNNMDWQLDGQIDSKCKNAITLCKEIFIELQNQYEDD